ncbi:MAG: ABC transporter [Ruminococcus sp.]|nr:ABC transporter [Ruminococcus sp.]
MGAIFRRELGSFFTSSIAYVFLGVFYLLSGWFFYSNTIAYGSSDMAGFFSMLFLVIVMLVPILTMKTFSEEKKQKTDQGLLTAPISLGAMVMGKYFAVLVMYIFGISIVLVHGVILSFFGTVDWTIVLSNYAALFLMGAACISIGMLISALTENQIVAAVVGMLALLLVYMLDLIAELIDNLISVDFITDALMAISFYNKYYEFTCGIFNLSSVLFYISVAVIFNFLTVRIFEKRRWS